MQVFSFLLSAVGFLLIVFATHLLFSSRGNLMLNRLLAVQMLARFGQICIFLLLISGYFSVFPVLQCIFIPFFFAAPACSYLYVRGFISGSTNLKKQDFLHFIPAFLAIIHVLPLPFTNIVNWEQVANQIIAGGHLSLKERNGLFPAKVYSMGQAVLLILYTVASWYLLFSAGFFRNNKWEVNKISLIFYLSMATFFKLLSFVALLLNIAGKQHVTNPVFLAISCLVLLFMMVFVLCRPGILYGYVLVSSGQGENRTEEKTPVNTKIASAKSKLAPQQQLQYAEAINSLMDTEQPFLSPGFQIIHLAQHLQIPVHHCSATINTVMGKNFRDWLNSYRVQYFIKQYPALSGQMTVETVAYQSGFKNITTFYNAFKKETGQMPTAYFEQYL